MSEELHSMAAAYALDAVDPEEARRFEAHLAGCEACRTEVREFRETAAGLVDPVEPGDAVFERTMAEVDSTRQLPPTVLPGSSPSAGARLLAVAAAVIVVVGGAALLVNRSTQDSGTELATVLAAPDAVTVELAANEADLSGTTLRLVYSEDLDEAFLVGSDLEGAGSQSTYQLWGIGDDGPASAGVFEPGDDGQVDAEVEVPSDELAAWGITIEPSGGSELPTGDILYQGTI